MAHYHLTCLACGATHDDLETGFLLACPAAHPPALLRTQYAQAQIAIQPDLPGSFRYANWRPVRRILPRAPGPVVLQSTQFGAFLGLPQLYLVFNGYWPERGALMTTGTFKELEAPSVCARIPAQERRALVVASAGNTGRAFLHVCSAQQIPAVIVVPAVGLPALWLTIPKAPCVKLVVLTGAADYFDAIRVGDLLAQQAGFFPEGGAKNVARRDGMGAVLLSFAEHTGSLPQHYFQAVGSGTGALAVWEMHARLLADGRFGQTPMQLHLAQNEPFTPMVDAWQRQARALPTMPEQEQRRLIQQTHAHVLTNRQPPYAIVGGVYDALTASRGQMYAVSNDAAQQAGELFQRLEGCDLDPAAAVAAAALIQAVQMGRVQPSERVALNVTGGGYTLIARDYQQFAAQPDVTLTAAELVEENRIIERLQTL